MGPQPPRHAAPIADTIAPDGSHVHLLSGVGEGATRSSLVEVRLAAGGVSRPIRHRTVEEIWLVLAGSGHVWRSADGSESTVSVGPGDALVIPVGAAFQFAAGPEGLRFACHTTPSWPGSEEALELTEGGLGSPQV